MVLAENGSRKWLPLTRQGFARLKKVQAALGLFFASYVLVHLLNVACTHLGPDARGRVLEAVRMLTGRPATEFLWVGFPLLAHALVAPVCMLHERALKRQGERALAKVKPDAVPSRRGRVWSARLHRWTGLALVPLIGLHVLKLRVLPGDLYGFERVTALFSEQPLLSRVSLGILALCASYHVAYGIWMGLINLGVLGPGRPRRWGRRAAVFLGVTVLLGVVSALVRW